MRPEKRYNKLIRDVQYFPRAGEMDPDTVYQITGPRELLDCYDTSPKSVVTFLCPCGCGRPTACRIDGNASPNWVLNIHEDDTVSLSPSVWSNKEGMCGSHYFLRRGKVEWC